MKYPIRLLCYCSLFLLCFAFRSINAQEIVQTPDSFAIPLIDSSPEFIETDSVQVVTTDSVKKKSNAIDSPVEYASKDSMIMTLKGQNKLYLFGQSSVKYTDLNLDSEYIEVNADSSLVYATFGLDSIGDEFGFPIFKQGTTEYEMRKVRYNFKSEKMFITDVITQQGEGYLTSGTTKKMPDDILYLRNGMYTTCDHPNPHYYLNLTKGKAKPGESVVFGPAYLVVEDVPLPFALPFGFFPFTDEYSSGIIMPTYGDELTRGFSLRDGGYYFAFSEYYDLALTGEIYTKGSWGINAASNYKKRYKFSGNFNASYLFTKTGERKEDSDYRRDKDFKLTWQHSQDTGANPFHTLSANVQFATGSYDRNQVNSQYSDQYTENTKMSSVSWSFRHPNSIFSLTANAGITQRSKDSTLSVTLPTLTISMREIYPFKRKVQKGDAQWYEKIRMSYTGSIRNSISNVKEGDFLKQNIIKDWSNGMQHNIPINASFNLFKYITISPNLTYTERWYTSRIDKTFDPNTASFANPDTTYGFYRVFNYSGSISANTKLYGMYKPWNFLGNWTKGVLIRHVMTPSISFSGAPDFSDPKYGYYKYMYYDANGDHINETYSYSPFEGQIFGYPGAGQTGRLTFSVDNNLEMKLPIADTDSTRKVSLIDNFRFSTGYNFLADEFNWSDIQASIRIKFGSLYTLNLSGSFDPYIYDEEGNRVNKTRVEAGKGIGRLRGTSTSFSYTLNNGTFKNLFSRKDKKKSGAETPNTPPEGVGEEPDQLAGPGESSGPEGAGGLLGRKSESEGEYDSDGYIITPITWSVSLNYSLSLSTNTSKAAFNKEKREYPYQINQMLGINGSFSPTPKWKMTFNTSYDFKTKDFAYLQCSVSREMHCWNMTAGFIPIGPQKSYNFTIAVSAPILKDLKYTQSSNYRDAMDWGD